VNDTATPVTTPTCDRLRERSGWNPNWEPFYALDPEWTERFMHMAMKPMLSGVLDAKTIEFIAIAVDASCTHMYGPGVRRHVRKALELGATQEEIAAVLQLTSVLGIHTMSLAAPILQQELAAHEAAQTAPR
jgi:alkylhydroperoxidase/carboxymuconolactone decarboxylase family protein YurZ